jgi:DNA-binding NarL/FixJ family response regulator
LRAAQRSGIVVVVKRAIRGETKTFDLSPPEETSAFPLEAIDPEIVVLSFPSPTSALSALSAAEREIAEMVARGLSNREIALARGTRERTIANQIAKIFKKLRVGSRVELARRM